MSYSTAVAFLLGNFLTLTCFLNVKFSCYSKYSSYIWAIIQLNDKYIRIYEEAFCNLAIENQRNFSQLIIMQFQWDVALISRVQGFPVVINRRGVESVHASFMFNWLMEL